MVLDCFRAVTWLELLLRLMNFEVVRAISGCWILELGGDSWSLLGRIVAIISLMV